MNQITTFTIIPNAQIPVYNFAPFLYYIIIHKCNNFAQFLSGIEEIGLLGAAQTVRLYYIIITILKYHSHFFILTSNEIGT